MDTRLKRLILAAVLVAFAPAALAQVGNASTDGPGRGHRDMATKKQDSRPKYDEKAYKDALQRIPDSKEKYDPWGAVRDNKNK